MTLSTSVNQGFNTLEYQDQILHHNQGILLGELRNMAQEHNFSLSEFVELLLKIKLIPNKLKIYQLSLNQCPG